MAEFEGVRYAQHMKWWDRYQAWQPERSWDRYQAWRLESRARWVATAVAFRSLVVFFFLLLLGSSAERALSVTAIFAVVAGLIWWFWYYPRVKAKSQPATAPQTTHP